MDMEQEENEAQENITSEGNKAEKQKAEKQESGGARKEFEKEYFFLVAPYTKYRAL